MPAGWTKMRYGPHQIDPPPSAHLRRGKGAQSPIRSLIDLTTSTGVLLEPCLLVLRRFARKLAKQPESENR